MAIMSHGFGTILSFTPSLTTKISIVSHPCRQSSKLPLMSSSGFSTVNPASTKDLTWLFRSISSASSSSSSSSNKGLCALYPNTAGGAFLQDVGATGLVMAGAYGLVRVFDDLTQRGVIQQNLSRKLVHVLSGLLFLFCWPIFSTSTEARYFAAIVPFVNCLRLVINGLSLATDEGLVKSVSREGNPKELLRGPLFYVLILILSAVIFWRDSPVGVMSLAMMCGGDGFADIIGRRFGTLKIPYNQQKSWAGSIAMLTFGFLISIGMLYYFSALGYFQLDWSTTVGRVALVSLVATMVESLPTTEVLDDNISVPLSTMAVAVMLFVWLLFQETIHRRITIAAQLLDKRKRESIYVSCSSLISQKYKVVEHKSGDSVPILIIVRLLNTRIIEEGWMNS